MLRPLALLLLLAVTSATLHAQTPVVNAKKRTGTITIDGNPNESQWDFSNNITKNIIGTSNNTSRFAVLWDSLYLYVAYTITDASKYNESANAWDDDAVEIYIDAENNGGTSYGTNDRQFAKEWNSTTIWERAGKTTGVTHAWSNITNGYAVEIRLAWSNIGVTNPAAGFRIGFDVAVNDDDNGGARESQQMWAGDNDNWQYPRNFGDLLLVASDAQAPTAPSNLAANSITQSSLNLSWTASTDNVGVAGYDIYRNGVKINSALVTTTTYSVTGLNAATAYQFYVQAKDAAGNTSGNSNTVSVTTPDTQAPSAPGTPVASAIITTSLTLTWTASSDNVGVTGYDVFQDGIQINVSNITGTSFSVTNLSPSTTYQFYIKAKDAAGNSTNSGTTNATTPAPPDTEAPTAPTDLAVTTVAQNSVTLSWTASTDNIGVTGYDVYRNGVKINSSTVTTTGYTATGLSAATAYSFYVVAKDAAGNTSGNSNTISVTTPDTQAPSAPGTPVASVITTTSLTLTWTAASDNVGVSGYDVFQDGVQVNTSNITGTSFNVTNLSPSTTYQFYVKAKDAAGNSTNSSTINATTPAPPDTEAPSAPTGLVASTVLQNSVTLNWTASTDNIGVTGYDVYRNGVKINSALVTTTSYPATGLSAATAYQFYVVAKDAAGNTSDNSNTISVTTPDTQAPSAPGTPVASAITTTSLTLTWTAASDNVGVAGYDVFQDGVQINISTITGTSFNVTNLSPSTTYQFYVKAKDATGNSTNSSTVNATTPAPPDTEAPSAPANLVASAVTATSLTLNWSASTDNIGVAGYDVYRNGTKINSVVVTTTSYSVTGLTGSTTYSFYVQARDAANNISANSNTISVTTPSGSVCTGTGGIRFQRWANITGTAVSNLTSNSAYINNTPTTSGTLTSFEVPTSSGDNYGIKVFGYICPPTTGSYTFWIASDDNAELWLSTSSNSANKVRIAYHTQWTNSREWNKYTTQKSAAITLTAGQLYYVEALMKEGSQGDNLAVGWAKPGQSTTAPSEVIPGSQLVAQINDTQAPTTPANLTANNITTTTATINWTAATDNVGIAGYDVYRNGTKLNSALVTTTSYTASGLTANTTYSFTVIAKDAAGNSSASSAALQVTTLQPAPGFETFTQRTVIANQRMPHDLVYGPDNNLWYTERFAGTVSYVVPATGAKTVVLSLGSLMQRGGGQDGLMGLALHPEFTTGKPYVYISYTYESSSATMRKTRIARYTYNSSTKKLEQPVTIIENIPGSNDHNSARLAIGPDLKLYYSVGDMGAGQFDNMNRTNNAQNLNILEGKILRLNTETINSSWIPEDNPFTNGSQKTAVYSFGHRNPQGLVWGNVNGADILYSSEHGPYSDDEINIIETGRNYGWPQVAGFCDGNYNGRVSGGFNVVSEQTNCATLNAKEPIRSLFPAANPPTGGDNMTWPSTGVCGTEFYGSTAIPGWQNSLLVANLKNGTLARFKLSSNGQSIISDTIHYFRGKGRFRDVVVSPDGLKIYLACDSSGSTSGPTGGVTTTPANPGSILEFTYQPSSGRFMMSDPVTATKAEPINETANRNIEVYPNPASDFIVVYNYSATPGLVMDLVDMNGKAIKRQTISNVANRVELGNYASGLYIIRITDAKGKVVKTEKIMVQK